MKKQSFQLILLFLAIGAGTSLQAQITKYGTEALFSNTTGTANSAFGYQALKFNTGGHRNSAAGYQSLRNNTTGYDNSSLGYVALYSNTTGYENTAAGTNALYSNTTGSENTALGHRAMFFNTYGYKNTGVGTRTLYSNTTGNGNLAMGYGALYANSTGSDNGAAGYYSMYSNTTGSQNAAFGSLALYANTIGSKNAAFGINSLKLNSTGVENSAFGYESLGNGAQGSYNAAFGAYALRSNLANVNSAFGYAAGYSNTTGSANCAVGYSSLYVNATGGSNTALGNSALYYAQFSNNVGIGTFAGGDGDNSNDCTYIGYNANNDFYINTYSNSTALGSSARITASNQVSIGNSAVTTIGGFANWTNFSDARFKKDVQENVPGLAFINKLRPVTYHLDADGLADYLHEDVIDGRKGEKRATSDKSVQKSRSEKATTLETGFLAQEVEAAAAELGYDFSGVDKPKNETDLYGLRYGSFTVPLVKAVQELSLENQSLREENQQILQRLEALEKRLAASAGENVESRASLGQNVPNPFSSNSAIHVFIPDQTGNAQLAIIDQAGKKVREISLQGKGDITVGVPATGLETGVYVYTLIVDGKTVETKKMVYIGK